jgi:parvulin-like peptidyl-prolyl isomerase
MRIRDIFIVMIACLGLGGCGGGTHTQPVSPQEFYTQQPMAEAPGSGVDQPGQVPLRDTQSQPPPPPPASNGDGGRISEAVRAELQRHPNVPLEPTTQPQLPATEPSTMPTMTASTEPVFPPGQYMTVGTLIAEVNGKPIYANKVLRECALTLRDYAREYDRDRFEIAARQEIERERDVQVANELELAAAQRNLSSDDRHLAYNLAVQWADHQINQAGSVEAARARALAQGKTFEEEEQNQENIFLVELYYTRMIDARVQVTASDERDFYKTHLVSDFSKPEVAHVFILHTDPSDLGEEVARNHLEDYRRQVLGGADFAALAAQFNSPAFRAEMTIFRNSFALRKVVDAIWRLSPGQVSDIVEDRGGLYLIKLISRDEGGVQSFDDEKVQDAIYETLKQNQVRKLRQAQLQRLQDSAIVNTDPSLVDATLDMAMQNYSRWAKR